MRYKQKILCLILIFTIILSFNGCFHNKIQVNINQTSNKYITNEDYQNYLNLYSKMAMTEDGYYFINNNHLCFFDKESLETIIVCNKVNCEHNDDSCTAYFSVLNFYPIQLAYYDDALYLLGWETEGANIHHNYIYQISLDNYKRKKSAFISNSNGISSAVFIIHRGYIYYVSNTDTMQKNTTELYRKQLGNTDKKDKGEKIFDITDYGTQIFGLSAYGNNVFFSVASYEDESGNGYNTSLNCIDIHTLKSKTIIENNQYSYFADDQYIYYERDKNTVNKINLDTNEETFFCNIDDPCYISADENYLYFDNQQAIYINEDTADRLITAVDKNTGKVIASVSPKNKEDECLFGGNDFIFFKEITSEGLQKYYSIDKTKLTQNKIDYIDMS